jgi:hypothetical protein
VWPITEKLLDITADLHSGDLNRASEVECQMKFASSNCTFCAASGQQQSSTRLNACTMNLANLESVKICAVVDALFWHWHKFAAQSKGQSTIYCVLHNNVRKKLNSIKLVIFLAEILFMPFYCILLYGFNIAHISLLNYGLAVIFPCPHNNIYNKVHLQNIKFTFIILL